MDMIIYQGYGQETPTYVRRNQDWKARIAQMVVYLSNVPTQDEMRAICANYILHGNVVARMGIGVSLCHPKDDFDKKVGRELAKKSAVPMLFSFSIIRVFEDRSLTVTLIGDGCSFKLTYGPTGVRPMVQVSTAGGHEPVANKRDWF